MRARVLKGRLVLDEPTTLPEGTEVELVPVDDWDDLEVADEERLQAALVASEEALQQGRYVSASELLTTLRRS